MSEFSKAWKSAKEAYELATEEKKPSKTFLGIRTGAGISKALTVLDNGINDLTLKGAASAYKAFLLGGVELTKLMEARVKELDKADAARKAGLVKASKMLLSILNDIRDEIPKEIRAAVDQRIKALDSSLEPDFEKLCKKKDVWSDFEAYCKKQMAEENVLFFHAYRAGIHIKNPQKIVDLYVKRGSKNEVNMSSSARNSIINAAGALVAAPNFTPMYRAAIVNMSDSYTRWYPDYIRRKREALMNELKGIPLS